MLLKWQRLERENAHHIIDSVRSASAPGLFSTAGSQVERAWLPFYNSYFLYKITNYASLPSFSFEYLGDGTFFLYLDGSAESIYAVNDKGDLHLNEIHALDYLSFYFKHVADEDGHETVLIQRPQDMPMLDSLDQNALQAVVKSHRPPVVTRLENDDGFMVKCDLYVDGTLFHAGVMLSAKGRVETLSREMILSSVHRARENEQIMV